jgi:hypothetical protein
MFPKKILQQQDLKESQPQFDETEPLLSAPSVQCQTKELAYINKESGIRKQHEQIDRQKICREKNDFPMRHWTPSQIIKGRGSCFC